MPTTPQNENKHPTPPGVWSQLSLLTTLGLSVVMGIAFFTAAGIWIDSEFEIKPVGLIIGVLIGVICGVGAGYLLLKRRWEEIEK